MVALDSSPESITGEPTAGNAFGLYDRVASLKCHQGLSTGFEREKDSSTILTEIPSAGIAGQELYPGHDCRA